MSITRSLITALLILGLWGCGSERNATVPKPLVGTWTTTSARYADRFLQFTKDSIIFGTGSSVGDSYLIVDVRTAQTRSPALYTITYQDPDLAEYNLSFYYINSYGGTIRFKNQESLVWRRQRS